MTFQADFTAALRNPLAAVPPGLRTWNDSDPGTRFAVYRNNVVVSLVDALAESFPVTRHLVGEEGFRTMAQVFVQTRPIDSRVLIWVGRDFPDFIEQFPPATALAYLSDVARLEWLRIRACHAADQTSLAPQALAQTLSSPDTLLHLQLHLHPSVQVLSSRFAVVSLWSAHQDVADIATVHPEHAEAALVHRIGLEVQVHPIGAAQAHCIGRLLEKTPLALATDEACVQDPQFDLGTTLGLLVQHHLIVATGY